MVATNKEAQTMIYFNQVDCFGKWLEERRKEETNNEQKNLYSPLKDVVPEEVEIKYSSTYQSPNSSPQGTSTVYNPINETKKRQAQKVLGNKGELLVYNLLCEKYGKERVHPRSEAFVDLGELMPGQAVSGDYDLFYQDADGNVFYVEVKTGSPNSFFISERELDFAMRNPDRYQLYVVFGLNEDNPKTIMLPRAFWNDEKFKRTDIIERIEYRF